MHQRLKIAKHSEAAGSIDPMFLHTPQYYDDSLSRLLGNKVCIKVETVQSDPILQGPRR